MSTNEQLIDIPPVSARDYWRSPLTVSLIVGGPLLVVLSELVAPRQPGDLSPAADAAFVIGSSDRFLWSFLIGLVAAAVLAGGFVYVATQIRGRGAVVGRVAAVLGVAGAVGLGGHMATGLLVRDLYLQDAGLASVVSDVEFGVAAVATVFPVILGLTLGPILLAVAAFRAGWVGWWVIVVAVLAFVADWSPTNYNTVLFGVLATVVFGAIAMRPGSRLD